MHIALCVDGVQGQDTNFSAIQKPAYTTSYSKLISYLSPFPSIADYWSNLRLRQGRGELSLTLTDSFVQGESQTHVKYGLGKLETSLYCVV